MVSSIDVARYPEASALLYKSGLSGAFSAMMTSTGSFESLKVSDALRRYHETTCQSIKV
jgi:hypothetical protein